MWTIIKEAGWPIWPLIIASVISLAIIIERFVALRGEKVAPKNLLAEAQQVLGRGGNVRENFARLENASPLGRIFAAAVYNMNSTREVMMESVEEAARAVTHDLDKYLTTLGTIAAVAPLLGLLGTVIGMVELFGAFQSTGHDVVRFASGISVALYNTAMGIIVAVPSMIFYRYFHARVDGLIVKMEMDAIKFVEILQGKRK
ncbi:MAG: MotA/TolQ/ExbB proton channel family protein [Methylobacillus sp.]|nr:MotA/TolQ/ExbB proton channel family protein [Methylobacillus sp.]